MGFYLYKGLKKPLILFGLMNQYIYYGGATAVGGLVLATLLSNVIGIIGLAIGGGIGAGGVWYIYKRQDEKGLYKKTRNHNELHIVEKKIDNKAFKKYGNTQKK